MSFGIDYSKFDNIDTDSEDEKERDLSDFKRYRETELPNGWFRVGHVDIHPDERKDYYQVYSETILTEDPLTFTPNPSDFKDGIVVDWGLKKLPIEEQADDQFSSIQAVMAKTSHSSRTRSMYYDNPSPCEQFVSKLAERKEAYMEHDNVQRLMDSSFYLKVSLIHCEKDVWRTIRVPAAIDLAKLQDQVLVPAMGWGRAYHGYVFEDPKDGAVLGPKKYSGFIDMMHAPMKYSYIMEDRRYPLAGILHEKGDVLYYTYDLGDMWEHKIEVLDVKKEKDHANVLLLGGAGACPPEDSNGMDGSGSYGYAEFLKEYKAKPKSLKMKEAIRNAETSAINYSKPWMGGPPLKFRPLNFDIVRHRLYLKAMIAGPTVQKKGAFGDGEFKESFKACIGCGIRLKALSKCRGCGAWYCSRDCQLNDWPNHKKQCKERRAKKEAKSSAR